MLAVQEKNADIKDNSISSVKLEQTDNTQRRLFSPILISHSFNLSKEKPINWCLKRVFDLSACIIGGLCILPALILVAIAIKLDSKGPVIFKQKRVGKHGKEFYMYKFRSMTNDAELKLKELNCFNEVDGCMFKMNNDPRVTRVGRFIRKFSIDELPQIFNVIKGDMSLVGPRPPIRRELAEYNDWHFVRFGTLPGLTGMWQVSGRSSITDFDKVVMLDYKYIKNWNFLLDLKLLLKTIPVVITGNGAS